MAVISVYTYGVKMIKKFPWKSGFLWGVPWNPPLCTNGSAGYLMQWSVNAFSFFFLFFFSFFFLFLFFFLHLNNE